MLTLDPARGLAAAEDADHEFVCGTDELDEGDEDDARVAAGAGA